MKRILFSGFLVVLFTLFTPLLSTGQNVTNGLNVRQPIPISLNVDFRADDGTFVSKRVTVLVDLNLENALREAGLSTDQIDAIALSPTLRTEVGQGVTAQAQIPAVKESTESLAASQTGPPGAFSGVIAQGSNLYGAPGSGNSAVAGIFAGEKVTIIERSSDGNWMQLENGYWIATSAVDLSRQESRVQSAPTTLPTREPTVIPPPTDAPIGAIANRSANLRSGPGTNYPVLGGTTAGQALNVTGQTNAGDWYQLASGSWIAAFLVDNAPSVSIVNAPSPPAISPPVAAAPASLAPIASNVTPPQASCDPSYPTICIPPNAPDLDCGEISDRRFLVLQPDPHRFDGDKDGIGCER